MNFLINLIYGEQENNVGIKGEEQPQGEHELTLPPIEALIFMA